MVTLGMSVARAWRKNRNTTRTTRPMLNAIVGFHLAFESLEGKAKLSQNKSAADIAGVIGGLQERGDGASMAVAALMQQNAKH